MNSKLSDTYTIVVTGLLIALEVVLQTISAIIPTGVNLNLSLIPITIGAIMFGPAIGGFLGLMCGVVVLLLPGTSVFMNISIPGTIIACLVKTTAAGVVAGFISKGLKEKNEPLAVILASISVPLVNTLIFAIITNFFFLEGLGLTNFWQIFTALIGLNFIFEVVSNVIISPMTYNVIRLVAKKRYVQ